MGNRQVRRQLMIGGRYNKRDGFPELPQPGVDVYPSIPERLFGVEKDVETVQREFREHREESIRHGERYATKDQVTELKEDMTKALADVNRHLDRRIAWNILQTAGLIVSIAYGLILSYKHFIQP